MAQNRTRDVARDVFRFQDLPPELRNSIYECYLAASHAHESHTSVASATSAHQIQHTEVASTLRAPDHPPPQPALACVNQQIRGELLPLYYASTCFSFDVSSHQRQRRARAWMSANMHHFKHLRTLCARGNIDGGPATLAIRWKNDNVTEFEVDTHLLPSDHDFWNGILHYMRESWLLRMKAEIISMGLRFARSNGCLGFKPDEWVALFEQICGAFDGCSE